jgi:hypothetical protein
VDLENAEEDVADAGVGRQHDIHLIWLTHSTCVITSKFSRRRAPTLLSP